MVALTVGAFVVPIFAPVLGVVMVWTSRRWTRRDKVLTTLLCLVPLLFLVWLGLGSVLLFIDR